VLRARRTLTVAGLDAASYRTTLLIWFSVATPNPADPEPGTCLLLNAESVFGFPIGD